MNKLNIKFKGRPSALSDILSGNMGLTDTQTSRLKELQERKDNYENSRGKAEDLAKAKSEVPKIKESIKELKAALKAKKVTTEDYEKELTKLEAELRGKDQSVQDLTAQLKGVAPLTDNMEKELTDLIQRKLNPELPQGAKTYVKKFLKEALFGRREIVKSKYLTKGNETEEDGFTLLCLNEKLGFILKNTVRIENDYLSGECDIDHAEKDTIFDNKSCWSLNTFPMFETELPDQKYYEQAQGYMMLYGRSKGAINYSLVDCPEYLLVREFPIVYNGDYNSLEYQEERYKVALNLVFTQKYFDYVKGKYFPDVEGKFIEIPRKLRTKTFYFDRSDFVIQKIINRVNACQKYLDTLVEDLLNSGKYEIH